MSVHRYPARSLSGDYVRSGAGLVFAILALTRIPLDSTPGWIMVALIALCLGLAARAGLRQLSVVELSDRGVRRGYAGLPLGAATLRWDGLEGLRAKFFPTARDRSKGWMQLVMHGGGTKLTVDSNIEDFFDLARAAARAAEDRGLVLGVTTHENLAALGIRVRRPDPPGDAGAQGDSR